jgi:glycine reductase
MERVVHYLNQFFVGLGGEESADLPPGRMEGPVGPGKLLQSYLGEKISIVATVYCGDNRFAGDESRGTKETLSLIQAERPDLFIAGPAFGSGRYGLACGVLSRAVRSSLDIPVITAMSDSNPAADFTRREVPVVATGNTAQNMALTLERIASLAWGILAGEALDLARVEGLLPRGGRRNTWVDQPAAERALNLLLAKLLGKPFETEIPLPILEEISPAPGLRDMRKAKVALVTTGGLVPRGNPDGIKSYLSTSYGAYDLTDVKDLTGDAFESVHGGFFTAAVNEDPDRLLPVDVVRDLVQEQALGALHETFYSTTGNGTHPEVAVGMAREIAGALQRDGVEGVILTSA